MKRIAFLFPGQGSQSVGMGKDLFDEFTIVRETFDMAEEIAKNHIKRLCFEGPMETLTETANLQPALTAVNLSVLAVLRSEGVLPLASAGHSLGEYTALAAANVIDAEACMRLITIRGTLMHLEATRREGTMSAVIGLPIDRVEQICGGTDGVVSVANHNMETQIVITGELAAVAAAGETAKGEGARVVPLKVSGAWHSELIAGGRDRFATFLADVPFAAPESGIVLNVTGAYETDPETIRAHMAEQFVSPVRWYDTMQTLFNDGCELFAEAGPGKVLANMVKKSVPENMFVDVAPVGNLKALETFLKAVK